MRSQLARWLDYLLLAVIGVFCSRYVLMNGRDFSETCVHFSFLKFPIFLGEFLLAGCLILSLVKWILVPPKFEKWHWLVFLYFGFVVIKAGMGYIKWGPLALRDSALFYYFAFAIIAYYAFRLEYFNRYVILVCYGVLIWMLFPPACHDYWFLGRFCLGLLLAYAYPDRRVGLLMALGILLFSPYHFFLYTNRTMVLGNFLAVAFIVITSVAIVDQKMRKQALTGGLLFVAALGLYMFLWSGSVDARTIFEWTKTAAGFKQINQEIEDRRSSYNPNDNPITDTPQIYHPDDVAPVAASGAAAAPVVEEETVPSESQKIGNSLFRLLIWRDAGRDLITNKPLFGFDFGKPFRAKSLEILRAAMRDWRRDGWIAMHNSYFYIIYRSGLFGIGCIVLLGMMFIHAARIFIGLKYLPGLLLCGALLGWFVAANFAVILEVPYNAIPVWVLSGFTMALAHSKKAQHENPHRT